MIMSSRTIFSDNGTLSDLSINLGNFKSGSSVLPVVAAQDYLYLGSDFPFNHRYIDVKVVNNLSSSITVHLWDGQQWRQAFDVIDQTSLAGVTLAQSGVLSWTPDDDQSWLRENTNDDGDSVTGLTGVNIRDLYWARLTFSNDLLSTTELEFVGHKFSDDNDLEIFYPDLTRTAVMVQFKAAKTNWKLQHIQAADEIIKDLNKTQIIKSENQILDWELFKDAGVHKVAEIAFNAFGKDFFENRDAARALYKEELKQAIYKIDKDNNARLEVLERKLTEGYLYR